jgi:His-Xaa-Ser system radical SAM maturase HxsB
VSALPVRVMPLRDGRSLFVNDAGGFFASGYATLERLSDGDLSIEDTNFLRSRGHLIAEDDALGAAAYARGIAERLAFAGPLDYLILVPTLRCNLACSYCQVSRVSEKSSGFDWTDETLAAVLGVIDGLTVDRVKIEFQGGEPTLRPDLIRAVIERCSRFSRCEFVVCTNLQRLDAEILSIFDRPDVFISTSLDGNAATHGRHRTGSETRTGAFLDNLALVTSRYGPSKVSALPTIDPGAPPEIDDLINAYVEHGFESIFLRPINFQGFARKRHANAREQDGEWRSYYERFVRRLIKRNWSDRSRVLEETYLSVGLRRVFRPGADRHVDLRNPNAMGHDYIVVDHDGTVYPTDEARMLARSGVIDLSIGTVLDGWAGETRDLLTRHATNQFDPACQRCAWQPFCGRDLVDDLARYGRIDLPRHETAFCRRHMHLFDLIFDLIYSDDPAVRYSLARWLRLPGTPASFGEVLQ